MNNQGYSGFLIRKTCQLHSQRGDNSDFNDFRNSNLQLYLNKKIGFIKSRLGSAKLPLSVYTNTIIQVKPQIDAAYSQKPQFTGFKVDRSAQKIVEKMQSLEYKDDFFIETNGVPIKRGAKNSIVDVQTKLKVLMDTNMNEVDLQKKFIFYKRQNLTASLNEIKSQMKNPQSSEIIQQRVVKQGLVTLELEDKEQVNFFMTRVCDQKEGNLTAGKVLTLKDDVIDYRKEIGDEGEDMRKIVQKRITQEQLNEINQQEEENTQRRLIECFKQTRPDQIDPDFFKSKLKMKTCKKLNEAQEKYFDNFWSKQETNQAGKLKKGRFIRNPNKFNKKFSKISSQVKNPLTLTPNPNLQLLRPNTAMKRNSSVLMKRNSSLLIDPQLWQNIKEYKELQDKTQNLVDTCNNAENILLKDKASMISRIENLEDMITKTVSVARMMNNVESSISTRINDFDKFLQERKFKKKLIMYLLDHVVKQSDLLSQKTIEQNTEKLFDKLFNLDFQKVQMELQL